MSCKGAAAGFLRIAAQYQNRTVVIRGIVLQALDARIALLLQLLLQPAGRVIAFLVFLLVLSRVEIEHPNLIMAVAKAMAFREEVFY